MRVRNDFFIFEPLQWQTRSAGREKILVKQNPFEEYHRHGKLERVFLYNEMQTNIFSNFEDDEQIDDFQFADTMQTSTLPKPVIVNEVFPKPLQRFAYKPCKGCGKHGCHAEYEFDKFGNRYLARYSHLKLEKL